MPTSRLEIDLSAIGRNLAIFREMLTAPSLASPDAAGAAPIAPKSVPAICAVIKQDAYGLGAVRIARKVASCGSGTADLLAVFSLDEARALADEPMRTPVLVLMPTRTIDRADPVYRLAVAGRLHFVLHDLGQAKELAATAAKLGCQLPVHVQLDTGMSRGGAMEPEATALVTFALSATRLTLAGFMTHFSSPGSDDAYTREQARAFRTWIDAVRPMTKAALGPGVSSAAPLRIHAANTAACIKGRAFHGNMIRIGQGLYGLGAEAFAASAGAASPDFAAAALKLQPALRWVSRIVHVHEVPAGSPVGYNRAFVTKRPTRVALVPVGYADGLPVSLSNLGHVVLTGEPWDRPRTQAATALAATATLAPIIGRISMDQFTIDVTDLPDALAAVGQEVEIIGRDVSRSNHLPSIAAAAGTITHELLCRFSPRIERVYTATSAQQESANSAADGDPTKPATTIMQVGKPLNLAV